MIRRNFKRKELSTPEKIELRRYIYQTIFFISVFFGIIFYLKSCHFK